MLWVLCAFMAIAGGFTMVLRDVRDPGHHLSRAVGHEIDGAERAGAARAVGS